MDDATKGKTANFDPQRFIDAQESVYATVLEELADGNKRTHWMWFIFPQIAGLGSSETSKKFAIPSLQAAQDYLAHPLLGARLRECTSKIFIHADREPTTIFGDVDALKFRSSMTLFDVAAAEDETLFDVALAIFFGGGRDHETLRTLDA
tara:strand:+ start:94 stop:543 length:450 start_codon:yes stop_codon:yes gene_type:complete